MTQRYQIVDCEPWHLSMVARRLRPEDLAEIKAGGAEPRALLRQLYQTSTNRWAAFVDGDIALVGGCAGPLASSVGEPWLFTTAAVERVPMAFAKESKRWLREVMATRPRLISSCMATYERSIRFWTMLGFSLGEPIVMPNGTLFRHLVMERT